MSKKDFQAMVENLPPINETEREWKNFYYLKELEVRRGKWRGLTEDGIPMKEGSLNFEDLKTILHPKESCDQEKDFILKNDLLFRRSSEPVDEYAIRLLLIQNCLKARRLSISKGKYEYQDAKDRAYGDLNRYDQVKAFVQLFRSRHHDGTKEGYLRYLGQPDQEIDSRTIPRKQRARNLAMEYLREDSSLTVLQLAVKIHQDLTEEGYRNERDKNKLFAEQREVDVNTVTSDLSGIKREFAKKARKNG